MWLFPPRPVFEQYKATKYSRKFLAEHEADLEPVSYTHLLEDLQSRNERIFLLTFLVVNMAPTRRELDNDLFTVSGIVQKYNCRCV